MRTNNKNITLNMCLKFFCCIPTPEFLEDDGEQYARLLHDYGSEQNKEDNSQSASELTPVSCAQKFLVSVDPIYWFWETVYVSSAIQAMFNAWAAMSYLIYLAKCSVGDFFCYAPSAFRDVLSIFVWWEVSCTFLANVAIAKVFMPASIIKFQEIMNPRSMLTWFFNIPKQGVYASFSTMNLKGILALVLAAACAIVSYKLGVDSLTLFQNLTKGKGAPLEAFGFAVDMYMLTTAVGSTFATRIVGCDTMLSVFMRWLPYLYDAERSKLLTMMHDASRLELNLAPDVRKRYLSIMNKPAEQMTADDYKEAYRLLPIKPDSFFESVTRGVVLGFKGLCYFLAIACYPIIYNITYSAFSTLKGWREISYAAALANVLFYTYALGRLPEEIYRACQRYSWPQMTCNRRFWLGVFLPAVIVGSSGSLLYSALNQMHSGQLDAWSFGFPRTALVEIMRLVLFAIIGSAISGLTNAFGLFRMDKKTFDLEFSRSETASARWANFVDNGAHADHINVIAEYVPLQSMTEFCASFWVTPKQNDDAGSAVHSPMMA